LFYKKNNKKKQKEQQKEQATKKNNLIMNNQINHKQKNFHNLLSPFSPCCSFCKQKEQQGEKPSSSTRFDLFITKLTHLIMKDGKKLKASRIILTMLSIVHKKIKKEAEKKNTLSQKENRLNQTLLGVLSQAIENVTPSLEVRKVRVSGSTYLVPAVLSKKKQETLALKWLVEAAKKKQSNASLDFSTCLADEILDASRKLGQARQKRDELHRLAQMNRAYIRYRWW
jgi:small subunit ribosomal protein S7